MQATRCGQNFPKPRGGWMRLSRVTTSRCLILPLLESKQLCSTCLLRSGIRTRGEGWRESWVGVSSLALIPHCATHPLHDSGQVTQPPRASFSPSVTWGNAAFLWHRTARRTHLSMQERLTQKGKQLGSQWGLVLQHTTE